jgi:hypothetical protein
MFGTKREFALLHFDVCICSYTGVYLHLDRRRSEIPPDLTMTKITDWGARGSGSKWTGSNVKGIKLLVKRM